MWCSFNTLGQQCETVALYCGADNSSQVNQCQKHEVLLVFCFMYGPQVLSCQQVNRETNSQLAPSLITLHDQQLVSEAQTYLLITVTCCTIFRLYIVLA